VLARAVTSHRLAAERERRDVRVLGDVVASPASIMFSARVSFSIARSIA
jgi:hypothetical protein